MPTEDYINFDYDELMGRRKNMILIGELVGEWTTRNGSSVSVTKQLCNGELIVGQLKTLKIGNVILENICIVSLWKKDGNHYSDPGLDLISRIRQTRKLTIG